MREIVTIEELAQAYYSTDHRMYRSLIQSAEVSKELERMLLQKQGQWRFAKKVEFQEEELEIIRKILWRLEEDEKEQEIECQTAYENVQVAQKHLKKAEKMWKLAKQVKRETEEKKNEMEELLSLQSKKLEQMKKFVLIHPTATLSTLDDKKDYVLVCTKFDADTMQFAQFADLVMEATDVELQITEDMKQKFRSIPELNSAVEYVKLAVQLWLEDTPYEVVHRSEAISYMLKEFMEK